MNTPQHPGNTEPIHSDFHSLTPTSCCLEHATESCNTTVPTVPTLASLDRDIACLDSAVENLNRIRLNKTRLRNQCIPIYSLPPEILQEIFIVCLNLDNENESSRNSGVPIPLRLGHICYQWRMIAMKLPVLWATVNCHVSHPAKSMIVAELLFDWISRSKECPLTIHISFENESLWTTPHAPTDIIDILALFSERWRDVSLTLPNAWQTSLSSIRGRLDNLETLRIQPPPPVIDFYPLNAFSIAPKLRTLSFERFYLQNLAFPWTNITKAAIGQPSLDEALEFISRCPLLTECLIINPLDNENNFQLPPPGGIIHGGMKDLTIMLQRDDQHPPILLRDIVGHLVTPSLERLTVWIKEYDNPLVDLSLLIERSSCPLSLVEIFGPTLLEEEIVTFICDTDCVSHITNNPREARTLNWTT